MHDLNNMETVTTVSKKSDISLRKTKLYTVTKPILPLTVLPNAKGTCT